MLDNVLYARAYTSKYSICSSTFGALTMCAILLMQSLMSRLDLFV